MQVITSKDNEKIKEIKKLKTLKYRNEKKQYIIEGTKLIEEAINEGIDIDAIVVCEECIREKTIDSKLMYEIAKYDCIYVTKSIFEGLTDVVNPQGLLAIINKKETLEEIKFDEDVIVILDSIQDPGNLGTILRTIDSVGLKQVIISNTTADVFNSKVVRSTMGAIFRVNIVKSNDLVKTISQVKKHGYKVLATSLDANKSLYEIDLKKVAIVVGNEANGISKNVLEAASEKMLIPMLGKTESLNASVATAVVLYEYVRQKISK